MAGAIERGIPYMPLTLRESFGNRSISEKEAQVIRVIDGIGELNLPQKRDIYFYDIWARFPKQALQKLKDLVGEIREDEVTRVRLRVESNDFLVQKYDDFHAQYLRQTQEERINEAKKSLKEGVSLEEVAKEANIDPSILEILSTKTSYELFISLVKKGYTPSEASKVSNVAPSDSTELLIGFLTDKHPDAEETLKLKNQGLLNEQIVQKINKPIKYVNNIIRAFMLFEMLPSHHRISKVAEQNEFIWRIMRLRSEGLGNIEISGRLDVKLSKVEDVTRFLVWIGLIEPISNRDALLRRFNKKDYKQQVREIINNVNPLSESGYVRLGDLYRSSNLEIGLDKFLRLFHEIEQESGQKIPRYRNGGKRKRSKSQ